MKALYIHGLHSNPNPNKLKIIEDFGLEVISPLIDYEKEQGAVYERVKKIAINNEVDMIIGSSLGGFIGFWLANEMNVPALLFNPALYFDSMKSFIPDLSISKHTPIYVCLGEKDEQVDPSLVRQYIDEWKPKHQNIKIANASWLQHGIDLNTFKSMTSWFLSSQDLLLKLK